MSHVCKAHLALSYHAPSLASRPHPWLQNVLSRIARVEYQIPDNMSLELQDLLGCVGLE